MAITLTTPIVPIVPSFDKVLLENLILTIEKTDYAKVTVQARLRLYHQDATTGVAVYSDICNDIFIDDAKVWAATLATAGNNSGMIAATNIAGIASLLVSTYTTWGATTVS